MREITTTTVDGGTPTVQVLDFFYDEAGRPFAVKVDGVLYYYITNLQGDVMQIVNSNGTTVATYDYDPYGNIISSTGSIAEINPFRYRGYVYDQDTELYYLQSRYYDPELGRWINADSVVAGVGGNVNGYNLFSYGFNNPVNMSDPSGNWPQWLTDAVDWIATAFGFTTSAGSAKTTGSSGTAKGPTISRNQSWGVLSSKSSASFLYATGSFRGQANQSVDLNSFTAMIGAFGKAAILNFDSQNRIGTQNIGISKKDVLDVGVLTGQAGIQYNGGLGFSVGAKVAAVAARGTYCLDVFGWKVEVGMSAQLFTYGYTAACGALPDGGWGIKNGGKPGVFSIGYLIRITPP